MAGIRGIYKKEELAGKHIVVIANLEKAVLRGIERLSFHQSETGGRTNESISIREFSNMDLRTRGNRVYYKDKPLKTATGDIIVEGVADNARVS
ncbi:hypothetical protein COT48_00740 [Candidatus Woesearchaeota archaeon CG08_land_8_20_14_0_20_47_9]|nr:MAG: hypothetical protein AUJ69_02555 [Candidatus Woesearchaeota archaeon CG1_02_47_18]PIN72341.1 MAG: hypothetical protein COV22_03470 [Candidatus Woesearchaeota archaeon CG10_big_fil_rev_8_21_14_0_10_47_5]PIO04374.1 MAG: hypothetical protein COT48_00740 [Candidatus Woesearchaeota archaeon CG08_land_8_20_14_0_20_47_9]HII29825.1 hypothetical protein [Candidatus Woesearchaeota archaeon]